MKLPVSLCHAFVGCVLATTRAMAVDPDGADNPTGGFDPDGVPLSVTQSFHPIQDGTQGATKASLQQQNREWLARMYQAQMQSRAKSSDPELSSSLRESNEREMARLAGLPVEEYSKLSIAAYRTGTIDSGAKSLPLRSSPAGSPRDTVKPIDLSKPFITGYATPSALSPLGAPTSLGGTQLFGTHSSGVALKSVKKSSSLDLDTPGMASAQENGADDKADFQVRMDALPGESPEQARAHQTDYGKMELALPETADQLHQDQKTKLMPKDPNSPATAKNDSQQQQQPKPQEPDPSAPMPVNQVAPISPIRAPIASPFDILNR